MDKPTPSFTLSSQPITLKGSWFVASSGETQSGNHTKFTLVPETRPDCIDRITVLLPAGTPLVRTGTRVVDPIVEAHVIGFDEARNPLYAQPNVVSTNVTDKAGQPVTLTRIYHGAYLVGAAQVILPGDSTKLTVGASIMSAALTNAAPALPPLTTADLTDSL